jgi:hypothetical protein
MMPYLQSSLTLAQAWFWVRFALQRSARTGALHALAGTTVARNTDAPRGVRGQIEGGLSLLFMGLLRIMLWRHAAEDLIQELTAKEEAQEPVPYEEMLPAPPSVSAL